MPSLPGEIVTDKSVRMRKRNLYLTITMGNPLKRIVFDVQKLLYCF